MRKHLGILTFTLIGLAILIPFASNAPDGLEKVAEALGIEEHKPIWSGLMPDYSLPTINNSYISTLLAGVFGTILVFGIAYLLGKAITKPNTKAV
jgi:hypothetical protein